MFLETRLLDLQNWTKCRHIGHNYRPRQSSPREKKFGMFKCGNLGNYDNLYLLTDTLLLACVFESFRKMFYSTYELDGAHFYTCSRPSGDAFFKLSNTSVELLTDKELLEMGKNLIRVGVASAFSELLATMKNDLLSTFNEMKAKMLGLTVEAHNVYGGVAKSVPLTLRDF